MNDDDVFYRISMNVNVDPAEIAKIVHDYIERDIGCGTLYDRFNSPPPPIYIGPVKIKTLKERLEEATMHEDCYFCIKRDICTKDVPKPCKYRYTEEERKADQASDQYGAIFNGMYLPKTYNKEEDKMKATSTEEFKDIIAIDFELQTFPDPDVQDKFIISATNRDDIFAFVFEGPNIADACKQTGLFTGWKKNQKIKELEEELGRRKKEAADCLKLRDEAQKEAYKLKQQLQKAERDKKSLAERYKDLNDSFNELTKFYDKFKKEYEEKIRKLEKENKQNKESADIWSREYYNLSKKFDKLQEEYKSLEDRKCHFLLHGMYFTPDELLNRILELERLKTPTIEDFADEEPADNVNHPSHYTGKYECIDVMQDVFGDEATNDFCLCNAFKYIWRARKKNGLEDVKKAVWYLNKYIEEAEKDGEDEVTGT